MNMIDFHGDKLLYSYATRLRAGQLTHLDVDFNGCVPRPSSESIKDFFSAISMSSLEYLRLASLTEMGDLEASILADVLSTSKLSTIILGNTSMTDLGGAMLLLAMSRSSVKMITFDIKSSASGLTQVFEKIRKARYYVVAYEREQTIVIAEKQSWWDLFICRVFKNGMD